MSSSGIRRLRGAQPPKGHAPTDRIDLPAQPAKKRRTRRRGVIAWVLTLGLFLCTATVLLGASLIVAVYWQARSDQARPVDAIVVLGAAQYDGRPSAVLQARLDTALEAWNAGYAPWIIVTGGKLQGDRFTEAESSRNFFVDNGVPESAILLENEGHSTEQSLDGVALLMSGHDLHSALFVSDGFHLLRTKYIAKSLGITGYGLPANGSPISKYSSDEFFYVLRESAGIVDFWWTSR
ncbi:MAG: YdcF family protein [Thermomicrobiales bacterium]